MKTFARICRVSLISVLPSLLSFTTSSFFFASTTTASALPSNYSSSPSLALTHRLEKRDPSYVPANIALEGCSVKSRNFAKSVHNERIQMGECYINARISPQAFAWFEPTDDPNLPMEGGVYGTCYAASRFPTNEELISVENVNYACFFWTEKGLGQLPTKLPGKEMIPFPVICPMNLPGCYSSGAYNPGHVMGTWGATVPTFSGLWKSSKNKSHGFMWCNHIQTACPPATFLDLQLENIGKLACSVANCPKYPGVTTSLTESVRASSKNNGPIAGPSYRIKNGKMITNAPQTQIGYNPKTKTGGTSAAAPGADLPPSTDGQTASGDGLEQLPSSDGKSTGAESTGGGSTGGESTGGGSTGGESTGGNTGNGPATGNDPSSQQPSSKEANQGTTTTTTPPAGNQLADGGVGGAEEEYCDSAEEQLPGGSGGTNVSNEGAGNGGSGLLSLLGGGSTSNSKGSTTSTGVTDPTTDTSQTKTSATGGADGGADGGVATAQTSVDPSAGDTSTTTTPDTTTNPLTGLFRRLQHGSDFETMLPRSHHVKMLHKRRHH